MICTQGTVITAVEIIASVLELLTVAGDAGIGPSVIATFFSISGYITRVNLTLIASILLVVVAALRTNYHPIPVSEFQTPQKLIQRQLQDYSPLGPAHIQTVEQDPEPVVTVKRVRSVVTLGILVYAMVSSQGCQSSAPEGLTAMTWLALAAPPVKGEEAGQAPMMDLRRSQDKLDSILS